MCDQCAGYQRQDNEPGISNDEYMGRLLRVVFDLQMASTFDTVGQSMRDTIASLADVVQSILNVRIEEMNFASVEDAKLHAEFVASNVFDIPIARRWQP